MAPHWQPPFIADDFGSVEVAMVVGLQLNFDIAVVQYVGRFELKDWVAKLVRQYEFLKTSAIEIQSLRIFEEWPQNEDKVFDQDSNGDQISFLGEVF